MRKELRGGKSYQKLGYVDYNLSDYILKYQQQNDQEFCVNRILKEYDTNSKKNQQRLDNSYLKIKIRILDQNVNTNTRPCSPKLAISESNLKEVSSSSSESASINKLDKDLPINTNIQSQSLTNASLSTGKGPIHTHTRNLSLTSNLGLISINNSPGYMLGTQTHNPYGHNRYFFLILNKSHVSSQLKIKTQIKCLSFSKR